MTRRILDHDPINGITTYFDYGSDDVAHITHTQDVSKLLDTAHEMRATADYSRHGIKNDLWHYARIPDVVAVEMLQKYGINIMAPKVDWKSVLWCINTHYPYLKTTDKKHA